MSVSEAEDYHALHAVVIAHAGPIRDLDKETDFFLERYTFGPQKQLDEFL